MELRKAQQIADLEFGRKRNTVGIADYLEKKKCGSVERCLLLPSGINEESGSCLVAN